MKGGTVQKRRDPWGDYKWVAIYQINDENPRGLIAPDDWYAWHEVRMYEIIEHILQEQLRAGIISGFTDKNVENIFNSIIDSTDLLWSNESSDDLRHEYDVCLESAIEGRTRQGEKVKSRSTKDSDSHDDFIVKERQILDRLRHYHEYKRREDEEAAQKAEQDQKDLDTPEQQSLAAYRKNVIKFKKGDASVLDELNAYRILHGQLPIEESGASVPRSVFPTADRQRAQARLNAMNKEGENTFGFDTDSFPEGKNSYGFGGRKRKSRKIRKIKKYTRRYLK